MPLSYHVCQPGNALICGISTDIKPSAPQVGWWFFEIDTGKAYRSFGSVWVEAIGTVEVINRTGVTLTANQCVVLSSTNNNSAVFASALVDARRSLGVVVLGGVNLATVVVKWMGKATGVAAGTIVPGDILRADIGTPKGRVIADNSRNYPGVGRALTGATIGQSVDFILSLSV